MTGDASVRPMGGCGRAVLAGERAWLLARIAEQPDLTLRAIVAELAARDVRVSCDAVRRFGRQAGMTFQKSLHAAGQDRPDGARKRERRRRHRHGLDPRRRVFIDETWAKTTMRRTHGRSPRGGSAWWPRCRTLTGARRPSSALRHDRIAAPVVFDPCRVRSLACSIPGVFDQPIDGETFEVHVEQALIPTPTPGNVVILDNFGSHKGKAVRQAIRHARAAPCWSSPMSQR